MRERNRLLRDQRAATTAGTTRWRGGWRQAWRQRSGRNRARRAGRRLAAAQDPADVGVSGGRRSRVTHRPGSGAARRRGRAGATRFATLAAARHGGRAARWSGPHRSRPRRHLRRQGRCRRAQCSTGEQKALLISLILANARALKEGTGAAPILLLDEVAAHLDSGRRAALYAELLALGGQAFLTGTGRELFAEFGPEAHHVRVTDEDGTSRTEEVDP